jgi:hypothetical protein
MVTLKVAELIPLQTGVFPDFGGCRTGCNDKNATIEISQQVPTIAMPYEVIVRVQMR